jgi:hypothetical protein
MKARACLMPKRGFTVTEAANYCGIPVKTIYEAKRRKATDKAKARFPVPGVKRGKTWLFDKVDLDAWLNEVFRDKE